MRLGKSGILVALSLAVVGCGGAATSSISLIPPTPTPTPVPKADAICQTYDAKISALTPPSNDFSSPSAATELPAIATWLGQVLTSATEEQAALAAEPGAAPINASFATVITKLQAVEAAAKKGSLAAYTAAYADYVNANTALSTAAKAAKLPDCA
jgi:hypothetical protein